MIDVIIISGILVSLSYLYYRIYIKDRIVDSSVGEYIMLGKSSISAEEEEESSEKKEEEE